MIDFAAIPVSDHARVKELMLLIQGAVAGEESDAGEEPFDADLQAVWYRQLASLVGKENAQDWFENIRFIFLAPDYRTLLAAVADYQQAPPVLYEENFDVTERCCTSALSNRIKLLYEIGHLAGILQASETFNNYTRVTQTQQDVCDRVIQWVEESMGLVMDRINVYLPFVRDYQQYKHLREENLYQIGIRAGLITEASQTKFLPQDQKRVIRWVKESFDIDLAVYQKPERFPLGLVLGGVIKLAGIVSVAYGLTYLFLSTQSPGSDMSKFLKLAPKLVQQSLPQGMPMSK